MAAYRADVYSDDEAAALYDTLNPWGADDDFYLPLVLEASGVLDVGCGTGTLLARARADGHRGRLVGIDPDAAMLRRARRHRDIDWEEGAAASMTWDREFELAVMKGHAFQQLVTDDELRDSFAAIRDALVEGGRFVFETRNPRIRAWEGWTPEHAFEVVDDNGRQVRISYDVESVVDDVVTLTETTSDADGATLRVDRASLRFLDVDVLDALLEAAGLAVDARYGGFAAERLEKDSPEIVTIARRH